MQSYAYDEIRELIETSGADPETQAFWLRYLNNVQNATWMTEDERERKIDILLEGINAEHDARYYSRLDVILRDTFKETVTDITGGIGGIGKKILDVTQNPLFLICAGGLLLLYIGRR